MPIMTTDWIEPATFASVPSHSQKEHACMPPLQGYDAQMRIAAPSRVKIRDGNTLTIPICARGILPVVDNPQLPRFVAVDTRTGKVYPCTFADGRPAAFHVLDGLPDELVVARDRYGRPSQVVGAVISGFMLDSRFYTREQGAAEVSRREAYSDSIAH